MGAITKRHQDHMMAMVITASINHSYGLATSACPIANNFSVLLKF